MRIFLEDHMLSLKFSTNEVIVSKTHELSRKLRKQHDGNYCTHTRFPYMIMFNLISQCMDLISEVITRPTEGTHPELSFQTTPLAKMPTGAPPWTNIMCGRLVIILTRRTYGACGEVPTREKSKSGKD